MAKENKDSTKGSQTLNKLEKQMTTNISTTDPTTIIKFTQNIQTKKKEYQLHTNFSSVYVLKKAPTKKIPNKKKFNRKKQINKLPKLLIKKKIKKQKNIYYRSPSIRKDTLLRVIMY